MFLAGNQGESLYTKDAMNQQTLLVALFFTFLIGTGAGFYLAWIFF